MYSFPSEIFLWVQMNQGDQSRFEREWRVIEPKLAGFFFRKGCPREDIDDLVQETALRSWANFFTLKSDYDSWVWGIARHVFYDYVRKRKRMPEMDLEDQIIDTAPDPGSKTITKMLLKACMKKLDPLDRKCLMLHDYTGKNLKEISEMLGISLSNVHYHVDKARKILQETFPELVK
jgi:RNA polymerase sigma-70 factor, ECF subfamily